MQPTVRRSSGTRPAGWFVLLSPIVALSIASWVGTLAAPVLAPGHPLLLVALSPRLMHLTLAAPLSSPVPFLLVVVARLAVADPFHFLIGRRGSASVADWLGRSPRPVRRYLGGILALLERLGLAVVALRPIGLVLTAAGASGQRALPVAVADLVGTVAHAAIIYGISRSVLPPLDPAIVTPVLSVLAASAALAAGARALFHAARPAPAGAGCVRLCPQPCAC